MKNSTASNVAVSLAGALAETVADYEARVLELQRGIEGLGRQLKQATDEQIMTMRVMSGIYDSLTERLIHLPENADERMTIHGVLVQLRDLPWPLPNPVPKSNAG